jgi:cytochrome c-type biogenesis protein CcmE
VNPKRKSRLYLAVFLIVAVGGTTAALMLALEENINMFYPPEDVVSGVAPTDRVIRAGGMVEEGSVVRSSDSLEVEFRLSDRAGSEFTVSYTGILPDLFREGQGIIVEGQLRPDGLFAANQVLAKHDENYMSPELMEMAKETAQREAESESKVGS